MKPVIQVFSVFSIPMWKKKTFFIKKFSIPLFVRHEFSSMTIQHRCPWLDMHQVTKHARAQLERMLSVFFFFLWETHPPCTSSSWKCSMVTAWYRVSPHMPSAAVSYVRRSYCPQPTSGELTKWGSHNGGKLHPQTAAQRCSSDRFNHKSNLDFLHYFRHPLQLTSTSVQSFQLTALVFIFLFNDLSVPEYPFT